jgi:hypothetical protein
MFEDAAAACEAAAPVKASSRIEALCALEAMEAALLAQRSREVRVWWCVQCGRESGGAEPLPSCREARHELRRETRTLHYFKCGACSHRLAHPSAMCAVVCPKCSARGPWLAASIHNIRDGDATGLASAPAQQEEIMSLRFA